MRPLVRIRESRLVEKLESNTQSVLPHMLIGIDGNFIIRWFIGGRRTLKKAIAIDKLL